MSVTLSNLESLVKQEAYPAMLDRYGEQELFYEPLVEVRSTPPDGRFHGDKGTVVTGLGEFTWREENESYQDDQLSDAFTWYCKIRRGSKRVRFDERTIAAIEAGQKVDSMIMELALSGAEMAAAKKNRLMAGMLQKGTLTAGSLEYFDGQFAGQTDPYRKFIYDGQPWFGAAHPLAASRSGATYSNIDATNALTYANLKAARVRTNATNAVNERGEQVTINHNVLLVPPVLEHVADQLVNSVQVPGSSNNDVNSLRGKYQVVTSAFLSDDAASEASAGWWTGQMGKMARVYDSGPPRLRVVQDPDGTICVLMDFFFGICVTNWRYGYSANKGTS